MPMHNQSKRLPYTCQQMYDLVADIPRYPEFLPWCAAARLHKPQHNQSNKKVKLNADLVISFKVFRETFNSVVELDPKGYSIITSSKESPFQHMQSRWDFTSNGAGCLVEFSVDFEFKNPVLQKLIGLMFERAMQKIVASFEARAVQLYGEEL